MTIKEIVGRIKKAVDIINRRKKEYMETLDVGESMDYDYETHFERLKTRSFSGMKYDSEYDTDFVTSNIYGKVNDNGKKRKKRKAELQIQMEDLETFIAQDTFTPEGQEAWEGRGRDAYETFMKHYNVKDDAFSLSDYANMVQQMGKLKNDIQDYGYEDKGGNVAYVNAYLKENKHNRERFFDVIKESYDAVKKKGIKAPTYKSILKEAKKRFKKL